MSLLLFLDLLAGAALVASLPLFAGGACPMVPVFDVASLPLEATALEENT